MEDLLLELLAEGFTVTLEPWDTHGVHVRLEMEDPPAGTVYATHRLETREPKGLRPLLEALAENVRRNTRW